MSGQSSISLSRYGSIGVEVGDPTKEFGNIEDVAVEDGSGTIFLVDRLNHTLAAFDRAGRFIASTGRRGEGPGEFRHPGPLGVGRGRIHVLDRGNLRISTYVLEADSLALEAETRVPFQIHDMCILNGDIFLLGYRQGKLLHRFDLRTGAVTASFGRPFRDDDAGIAALTAFGLLLCDEESQSIYVTANSIPTVRRYSPTGRLVWEAEVPKISSIITRTARGVRYAAPENGGNSEVTVSLTATRGGGLLLQFGEAFRGVGTLQDIIDVTSVVYDRSNGNLLKRLTDVPRIDLSDRRFAYSHGNDPFPRLIIYRWR